MRATAGIRSAALPDTCLWAHNETQPAPSGPVNTKATETEMLYLKACPRCRGDVRFIDDIHGPALICLQCGFTVTSANREVVAAGNSEKRARATRTPGRDRIAAAS